jgi:hypothetical protein
MGYIKFCIIEPYQTQSLSSSGGSSLDDLHAFLVMLRVRQAIN